MIIGAPLLLIMEIKLDDKYPILKFHIDGYSMSYILDRNRNRGGVIVYVREDIPSKVLRKHISEWYRRDICWKKLQEK